LRATNPPPYTSKPFNTLTVSATLPAASSFTNMDPVFGSISMNSVLKSIADQLKTTENVLTVVAKLSRVDLWSLPKSASIAEPNILLNPIPSVRMKVYSLVPSFGRTSGHEVLAAQTPLKLLVDEGMPGQSAAVVSYSFPRDQSDVAHANVTNPFTVFKYHHGVDCQVTARYHVHWTTADSISPEFDAGALMN